MNNFEQLIEEIDKDTKFRHYTKDLIRRHSDKKHSILPYEIDVRDVYSILKDFNVNENQKYVVFFNFEFVVVLKKLGISLNNIIFISGERKFYGFIRNSFGKFGLKTILFDTKQYQKYKSRKKWKNYIMKKIGKLNEYVVVGNIPFTTKNENSQKGMINIGNDFIKLMNQFKKSCYILHAKYDSSTFQNEIIKNKNLRKITNHSKPIFDINSNIYTCTVLIDSEYESDYFTYSTNIETKEIKLDKKYKLALGRTIDDTISIDNSKLTLGDLWKNGNRYLNQLTNSGRFKVIKALGSYKTDEFEWTYDDFEDTSFGKWKVILPTKGGGKAVKIASPEYSVCFSVVSLEVESEDIAKLLRNWIVENDILSYLNSIRTSGTNSKALLSKIVIPDGII